MASRRKVLQFRPATERFHAHRDVASHPRNAGKIQAQSAHPRVRRACNGQRHWTSAAALERFYQSVEYAAGLKHNAERPAVASSGLDRSNDGRREIAIQ